MIDAEGAGSVEPSWGSFDRITPSSWMIPVFTQEEAGESHNEFRATPRTWRGRMTNVLNQNPLPDPV